MCGQGGVLRRAASGGALACLVVLVLAASQPAAAFIPKANRIAGAVAQVNRASGRTQALRIQLSMRFGDGEPVAAGELVTHPTGLARLELRAANELVERHLLQGSDHIASRRGELLAAPRPFLPPLFLLQADEAVTLRAALSSYGIDADLVGLALCEEEECFVLGDPARVPPPTEEELAAIELPRTAVDASELWGEPLLTDAADDGPSVVEAQLEVEVEGQDAAEATAEIVGAEAEAMVSPANLPSAQANVWIDMTTFEVRRIESAAGVGVELGPLQSFGPLRFPGWVVIHEPDQPPVTLEFLEVVPVNAPATAFSRSWLMAPVIPAAAAEAPDATEAP